MLFKDRVFDLLSSQDEGVFLPHYKRLVNLRFRAEPMNATGGSKDSVWMPHCHHVSHAYAQAFGVEVVDGEKVFIAQTKTRWFGNFISGKVLRYAHSWNLLSLPSGKRVILDLFPDETCSMLPIVVLDPHPAYTVHWDGLVHRGVQELFAKPDEQERLNILVAEFKRIDKLE